MKTNYDVVILGGGLAGLTLAMQLKKNEPQIEIAVLELRRAAAPDSAHKVGESTVELGTYYLREVLGLKDYLEAHQLPKMGLRFFFSPHIKDQIDQRVELGTKGVLPVPSHQLDRGTLENELARLNSELGVDVIFGARVQDVDLNEKKGHTVTFTKGGETVEIKGNWVADATSRVGVLKRKLGFELQSEHDINAAWFRVKGEIDIDNFSNNMDWRNKLPKDLRRLGTVHFMGEGYWLWFIPLGTGNTSIGIVADPRFHDFSEFNRLENAWEWIKKNEPNCYENLQAYRNDVLDFKILKHYSHNSGRFYSPDKWGVVGEAGAFLDPFYSPGTDFISVGNTWLSDLILRDYRGEDVASRAIIYERVHSAYFNSWMPIYLHQYELFGNTQVMLGKILWDWAIYWAIPTLLFTNNGYTNMEVLRALFTTKDSLGERLGKLNEQIQVFFREWKPYEQDKHSDYYLDFFDLPFMRELHLGVVVQHSTADLIATCHKNLGILEEMAAEIFRKTSEKHKGTPKDMKVNPYKMSLKLSNEVLLQQSKEDGAMSTSEAITNDLKLMWL